MESSEKYLMPSEFRFSRMESITLPQWPCPKYLVELIEKHDWVMEYHTILISEFNVPTVTVDMYNVNNLSETQQKINYEIDGSAFVDRWFYSKSLEEVIGILSQEYTLEPGGGVNGEGV